MATLIREYEHFQGERKDVDLSKLFITVNGKKLSLDKCYLLTNSNSRQYVEIKSYSDFRTAFKDRKGGLYTSNNSATATKIEEYNLIDGTLIRNSEASEFPPVDEHVLNYADYKTYDSQEIEADEKFTDETVEILPGMERTLTVETCELGQKNAYVMVSYAEDKTNKHFVKLDDLFIVEGEKQTALLDYKKELRKNLPKTVITKMVKEFNANFEKTDYIPDKNREDVISAIINDTLTPEKLEEIITTKLFAKNKSKRQDLIHKWKSKINLAVKKYINEVAILEAVQSKTIQTKDGKKVLAISFETGFKFPQYQKADVLKGGQIQELTIEDGKQVLKPKAMAKGFSIYSSETVKEPDASGKEVDVKKVAISSYKAAADGAYIKVTLKGETKPSMVLISNCYYEITEDGKAVTKKLSDCANLIKEISGKSLTVYIDGKAYTTETMSVYDLGVKYNPNNTLIPTKDDSNKLADNAYLKLQSGEYVPEYSAVQPIAYKYTDKEENATAYLIEKEGKQLIIAKDKIKWLPEGKCEIEGQLHSNIKKLQNLARAPYNDECDVAQITSKKGNTFEHCVNFAEMTDKKEKAQALKTTQQSVHSSYKSGNYDLTNVYVKGELKDLTDERYLLSNKRLYEDYAENSTDLACVDGKLQYKDGKLVGGPHYDANKANAKAFKTIGKELGSIFGACLGKGGMLGLLLLPGVMVASAVVGIGAAIAVPIINGAAAKKINNPKHNFPDKIKENQNKWKADVETLMQKALDEAKSATGDKQLSVEQILAGCAGIDTMLQDTMSAALGNNGFTLENGECKVTTDNAHAIQQVMNGNKQLNGNECAPTTYGENKDYAQTASKAQLLKAFMLLKYAKISPNEAERSEIEKAIVASKNEINVANIDFDLTTGKIKVDGAEYSLEELSHWDKMPEDKKQNIKKIYEALSKVNETAKLPAEEDKVQSADAMTKEDFENLELQQDANDKINDWVQELTTLEELISKINDEEAKIKFQEQLEKIKSSVDYSSVETLSNEQLADLIKSMEDNNKLANLLEKVKKVVDKQNALKINTGIISEKSLLETLKASGDDKKRKAVIEAIKKATGVEVTEQDILQTILRIEKYLEKNQKALNAATKKLKNQNIYMILEQGLKFLEKDAVGAGKEPKQNESEVVENVELDENALRETAQKLIEQYDKKLDEINNLLSQYERCLDKIGEIRSAFADVTAKRKKYDSVNKSYNQTNEELNRYREIINKGEGVANEAAMLLAIQELELKLTKLGDEKYTCNNILDLAQSDLDKLLKPRGFTGKTLEEIEQIIKQMKETIEEKIADKSSLERRIKDLQAKLQAISSTSI